MSRRGLLLLLLKIEGAIRKVVEKPSLDDGSLVGIVGGFLVLELKLVGEGVVVVMSVEFVVAVSSFSADDGFLCHGKLFREGGGLVGMYGLRVVVCWESVSLLLTLLSIVTVTLTDVEFVLFAGVDDDEVSPELVDGRVISGGRLFNPTNLLFGEDVVTEGCPLDARVGIMMLVPLVLIASSAVGRASISVVSNRPPVYFTIDVILTLDLSDELLGALVVDSEPSKFTSSGSTSFASVVVTSAEDAVAVGLTIDAPGRVGRMAVNVFVATI